MSLETGLQFPMRDENYQKFYKEDFLAHSEEILLTQRALPPQEIQTNSHLYLFLLKNSAFLAVLKNPNFYSSTYNLGIEIARRYMDQLAQASGVEVPILQPEDVRKNTEFLGQPFNPKYLSLPHPNQRQALVASELDTLYGVSWERMKADEPHLWTLLADLGHEEYAFGAPLLIGSAHYYFPIRDSITGESWPELSA
jgi:hypothetical protein